MEAEDTVFAPSLIPLKSFEINNLCITYINAWRANELVRFEETKIGRREKNYEILSWRQAEILVSTGRKRSRRRQDGQLKQSVVLAWSRLKCQQRLPIHSPSVTKRVALPTAVVIPDSDDPRSGLCGRLAPHRALHGQTDRAHEFFPAGAYGAAWSRRWDSDRTTAIE
jgi:hypothetical protein